MKVIMEASTDTATSKPVPAEAYVRDIDDSLSTRKNAAKTAAAALTS
jgi:hypothetical protein